MFERLVFVLVYLLIALPISFGFATWLQKEWDEVSKEKNEKGTVDESN